MAIKAFTYNLGVNKVLSTPKGDKDADVIQQNAGWVVAFFPFSIRDTKTHIPSGFTNRAVLTREPFVVINDCVRIQTSHSKDSPFGSLEGMFKSGDINYLSAVAPGDIIMAWMHSDINRLDSVIRNVEKAQGANSFNSGLKFLGRIESVREILQINPINGVKQLLYQINAFSFQEFNTKVYQNFLDVSPAILFDNLRSDWEKAIGELENSDDNVQSLVRAFVNVTMGAGPNNTIIDPIKATPNEAFLLPRDVAKVLNRNKKEDEKPQLKYTDILTMIQGIQEYSNTSDGFKPSNMTVKKNSDRRQFQTSLKCTGANVNFSDKWNDIPIWSILKQYTNSIINELYTTLRVDADGKIVPTLIMRQIPFSTEGFKKANSDEKVTTFLSLPRWKPHPAQVLTHNIGRSNSLRDNYVQIWGSGIGDSGASNIHAYQAAESPQYDPTDIKRSGLRTYIVTSSLDFVVRNNITHVPSWSKKIADWAINGHLKLNGTVMMVGIHEPICVGDNFEWNGVVYHIERVTHTCEIGPSGIKTFRTTVDLSNGLNTDGSFPYMDKEFRENLAAADKDSILPGYSDIQDIGDRKDGETIQKGNRSNRDLSGKGAGKETFKINLDKPVFPNVNVDFSTFTFSKTSEDD